MSKWKEITPGTVWNYKEEKKGATFIGVFIEKEENVGENSSNVYSFKTEDGEIRTIWGSTLLDIRFKNLEAGEEVKVEYLGKEQSEKRKGATYHNFRVFHRKPDFVEDPTETVEDQGEGKEEKGGRDLTAEEVYG